MVDASQLRPGLAIRRAQHTERARPLGCGHKART